MQTYDVRRQHLGDKMYYPGDQRSASRGDVQHLINNGVLVDASKEAPPPANKGEPKVANKADAPVQTK